MTTRDWDSLVTEVREHGGLLKIQMSELRNILGNDRLGKDVVEKIKAMLTTKGLSFYPLTLSTSQTAEIYLFNGEVKELISKLIGDMSQVIRKELNNFPKFS